MAACAACWCAAFFHERTQQVSRPGATQHGAKTWSMFACRRACVGVRVTNAPFDGHRLPLYRLRNAQSKHPSHHTNVSAASTAFSLGLCRLRLSLVLGLGAKRDVRCINGPTMDMVTNKQHTPPPRQAFGARVLVSIPPSPPAAAWAVPVGKSSSHPRSARPHVWFTPFPTCSHVFMR